uniref:Uncharacterized protein n=1 Tax=Knipowitschia caucasica TaxID=637954 RepID=A0AAV2LGE3_KNICA
MATGVIRSFLVQPLSYFPLSSRPSVPDEEQTLHHPEESDHEDEEELHEEEEEEESFTDPAPMDTTNQLLRFADLISRDIQQYFGRSHGDQDACDIYSDSVSLTTSGRLRYYDDLLKIAKGGTAEERHHGRGVNAAERQRYKSCEDGRIVTSAAGSCSSLGPLAELFDQTGASQGRPMTKRLLPLSFWTEPSSGMSCGSDKPPPEGPLFPHTHLEEAQMDFSDLLAFWDTHPEPPQPLTDHDTSMQH